MACRKVLAAVAVVAALAFCAVVLTCCQTSDQNSAGGKPLFALLREAGYPGDATSWVNALADEQKAAIDIAYEADLASGYQGSESDWVSSKVRARYDSSGDVVVILPDGGEFEITPGGSQGDGGGETKSTSSESHEGSEGEPSAKAASGAVISVDSVHARPNDRDVALAVRIDNNPGIMGATLSVSYDESALTLKNAENGDAFKGVLSLTHSRTLETGCLFTWDGVSLSPADVKDGAILTLYFDVASDAASGSYPVAVRSGDSVFDADLKEVGVSVQDGSVLIG